MSRPFIPVPNTASVEFIYSNAGEVNENVVHFSKASPYTLANLQALRALCTTWDNTYNTTFRTTVASLYRIRTRALDSNSSPTEDYYLPTPQAGIGGGSAVPLNVAICVKLSTGLQGRSYRGRWYAGNLSTGALIDAGHTSPALLTNLVAALNHLRTDLLAAGHTLCVVSYRNNFAWRTTGAATPATGFVGVDVALDSQRRRLPGRGHSI